VLLADDHRMVADALAALLKGSCDLVALVPDGQALLQETTRLKPDVIVADVFMPVLNGIDAARQLRARGIHSKIVFLTVHADPRVAAEAFRAGASAFVSKESAGEELIQAIQDAARGRVYLTPLVGSDVTDVPVEAQNSQSRARAYNAAAGNIAISCRGKNHERSCESAWDFGANSRNS